MHFPPSLPLPTMVCSVAVPTTTKSWLYVWAMTPLYYVLAVSQSLFCVALSLVLARCGEASLRGSPPQLIALWRAAIDRGVVEEGALRAAALRAVAVVMQLPAPASQTKPIVSSEVVSMPTVPGDGPGDGVTTRESHPIGVASSWSSLGVEQRVQLWCLLGSEAGGGSEGTGGGGRAMAAKLLRYLRQVR